MKKIKFNEKLNLNKSIVSELNSVELNGIAGGRDDVATRTGPDVCTAMPTFACCGPVSTHPACTKSNHPACTAPASTHPACTK